MPTNLEPLLARARAVRADTMALVRPATADEVAYKPGPRYSIPEILIHLGNWEAFTTAQIRQVLRGEAPTGVGNLDAWNAAQIARHAHLDLAGIWAYLEQTGSALAAVTQEIAAAGRAADPPLAAMARKPIDHEVSHQYQIRENLALARGNRAEAAAGYLGYARCRVLIRSNLEQTPAAAFSWRPTPTAWSIKDVLMHLVVWERYYSQLFHAMAAGAGPLPLPYPAGGMDRWNQEQAEQHRHRPLADVLHELGAARGALLAALRPLQPEHWAVAQTQSWLQELRDHDHHHMRQVMALLKQWQEANTPG